MTLKPCLSCGQPSPHTRCPDCSPEHARATQKIPTTSAAERGYDHRWTLLSRRARRLQPWCTDCGTEDDLQLDHTPQTWERYEAGLPIRLEHTGGVVCHDCNVKRGTARPGVSRLTPGGKRSPTPTPTPPGQAQKGLRMVLKSEEGR